MKKEKVPDNLLFKRKSDHLRIVANEDVVHAQGTLLDDIKLFHQALPEIDAADVDTSVEFFGKVLKLPLMITSMTGGAEQAGRLNHNLAAVAQKMGIGFAVGSQRVMIHHPEVTSDFAVRSAIPDGVLLGNIGAVQLHEHSTKAIKELVNAIEADGICVHLNAAQELMQAEGHRDFADILKKIAELVEYSDGRVLVKETGTGLSPRALKQLDSIGVRYVDVSGAGGTSWTKVEAYRAENSNLKKLGEAFADWGVPTAFSIIAARKLMNPNAFIIGSGGVLNGIDAARCIVAGADIAGFARPALLAFLSGGSEAVIDMIKIISEELKAAMVLTGSKDILSLQTAPRVYGGELLNWLKAHNWPGGEYLED